MRLLWYKWLLGWLTGLCFMVGQALADVRLHEFESPEQKTRYEQLIAELRCPKCLNTNLAGSDAPIAADLRQHVHNMLKAKHTDAEILAFMQSRYGDFILYKPRLTAATLLLWFGPLLMLAAGLLIMWYWFASSKKQPPALSLTAAEHERLRIILSDKDQQ